MTLLYDRMQRKEASPVLPVIKMELNELFALGGAHPMKTFVEEWSPRALPVVIPPYSFQFIEYHVPSRVQREVIATPSSGNSINVCPSDIGAFVGCVDASTIHDLYNTEQLQRILPSLMFLLDASRLERIIGVLQQQHFFEFRWLFNVVVFQMEHNHCQGPVFQWTAALDHAGRLLLSDPRVAYHTGSIFFQHFINMSEDSEQRQSQASALFNGWILPILIGLAMAHHGVPLVHTPPPLAQQRKYVRTTGRALQSPYVLSNNDCGALFRQYRIDTLDALQQYFMQHRLQSEVFGPHIEVVRPDTAHTHLRIHCDAV